MVSSVRKSPYCDFFPVHIFRLVRVFADATFAAGCAFFMRIPDNIVKDRDTFFLLAAVDGQMRIPGQNEKSSKHVFWAG